jgi:glycosyltransferase involved in cell wall biosynthesis
VSEVRLSIIIPTIGRKTLAVTLASILFEQFNLEKDEIIVVGDGSRPEAHKIVKDAQLLYKDAKINYYEHQYYDSNGKPTANWGNPQRNFGLQIVSKTQTHVALIDDDDVYTDDAFENFRKYAADVPVIFKMLWKGHYHLWRIEGHLECGNFGTPCFLVPRVSPMPQFGMHYAGDADYIIDACKQIGDPIWRPETVALIRPLGEQE